jgi:ferredoxin, 2Fe-2S
MATIIWNLADGSIISAEVTDGTNLMNAAVANNVASVVGECGGCLSCATCHVFVDASWSERAGKPDGVEDAMLEITETPRTELSRLSCQIIAAAELNGLVLTVPQT